MKPLSFLAVAVVAVFQFIAAPPVGYMLGLDGWAIFLATWIGSVGGTVAMVYAGGWIWPRLKALVRMIRRKRKTVQADKAPVEASGRVKAIVDRHGAVGLGLVAPFTIGGFAGAILGVGLGLPKAKLALWLAMSLTVYISLYTLLIGVTVAKT